MERHSRPPPADLAVCWTRGLGTPGTELIEVNGRIGPCTPRPSRHGPCERRPRVSPTWFPELLGPLIPDGLTLGASAAAAKAPTTAPRYTCQITSGPPIRHFFRLTDGAPLSTTPSRSRCQLDALVRATTTANETPYHSHGPKRHLTPPPTKAWRPSRRERSRAA